MSKFDEETKILPLETRFKLADSALNKLEALKGITHLSEETYRTTLQRCGLQGPEVDLYFNHCLELEADIERETREIRLNTIKFALKHPFAAISVLVDHIKK